VYFFVFRRIPVSTNAVKRYGAKKSRTAEGFPWY